MKITRLQQITILGLIVAIGILGFLESRNEGDAGHAFMDEYVQNDKKNPLYREAAAERAWKGLIPFIREGRLDPNQQFPD